MRQGSAQYFAGRDPNAKKAIIDRVDKFYSDNPEGYRRLWAGTPMEDPRVLARTPLYAARGADAIHYPRFQAYYQQAFADEMDTPQMKQLSQELQKYYAMPDPEAMRAPAISEGMQDPTKGGNTFMQRFTGYVQRRMMFEGMVAGMSGGTYGMIAKKPQFTIPLLAVMMTPYARDRAIAAYPEAYWNLVRTFSGALTSKTAEMSGRAAAQLAMAIAIDGMHRKAHAATAAAAMKTPEPVVGVPTTDPNAVAVP